MSNTKTKSGASTDSKAKQDVKVEETAPASSTAAAAPVVPTPSAEETQPKVRLFHRKACDSVKDSTNTVLKEGEVFNVTNQQVQIENPDEAAREKEPYVTVPVYSLKRGKRIYYTPYVTPEQAADAQQRSEAKAKEKAEKEAAKKAEKEAKEAAKKAEAEKAAAAAAAATPPAEAEKK